VLQDELVEAFLHIYMIAATLEIIVMQIIFTYWHLGCGKYIGNNSNKLSLPFFCSFPYSYKCFVRNQIDLKVLLPTHAHTGGAYI
jgi:hypothetical protein